MDDKRIQLHKIVVLKHGNQCSVIGIKHIDVNDELKSCSVSAVFATL